MSERNGYEPGVPCWVAGVHPDPEQAVGFYTTLFGWEAEDTMPSGSPGRYFVCTLHGWPVAAIGSERGGGQPPVAAWGTHVWVDSADAAAEKVTEAGGSVVTEPFDLLAAARVAVCADPAGAVFCLWEPAEHRGARLVNEPGAWSMSALNTTDLEGAKDFYAAVFGWESDTFAFGDAEMTMLRLPGYVGGEPLQPVPRDLIAVMAPLEGDPSGDEARPHWSANFWVADADATAGQAAELGGRVIVPPLDTPVGKSSVLADPQGAAFSVSTIDPAKITEPAESPA